MALRLQFSFYEPRIVGFQLKIVLITNSKFFKWYAVSKNQLQECKLKRIWKEKVFISFSLENFRSLYEIGPSNVSIIFFTDKEQMPAPKSLVLTFVSLCLMKSLHVFALMVSRLSTILMTERFRVNARTVLMNCLTELAPSKMELAGMFVCLFVYLWGIWGIK